MYAKHKFNKYTILIFILAFATLSFPNISKSSDMIEAEIYNAKEISLASGKSIVLRSIKPIDRVSVANPEIADFLILSPHEIYITAKTAGTTNLSMWQKKKIAAIFNLEVSYDISSLKEKINSLLPDEQDLKIIGTHDSITLAGKISNTINLSQAIALASAYAPEEKIINLCEVGGVHQVMLEVRIAEMSRSLSRRLGVNFAVQKGDQFAVNLLDNLHSVVQPDSGIASGPVGFEFSSAVNALFRFDTGDFTWTAFIDALKEDGLVKILAEPNLITTSGQSANFLAGGEFPVPVPQGLGTVGIEYKPFGVGLVFTPVVLSKDKISIEVTPEISELDFSTAVAVEGFVSPGLSTRRASTKVELADGQSFAIAGLIRDTVRTRIAKYPILGDIPVLGVLFQSKSFQKNETELVIIVTPHLVKPLDMAKMSLPTDYYVEPSESDFFLYGKLEGNPKQKSDNPKVILDGDFGHSIPDE